MPFKNRRSRRPMRRNRRSRRPRLMRNIAQPIQYFKRSVWSPSTFNLTNGIDNFRGLNFRLNQLPNFSEFTSLYDQYKICGVKVELYPRYDTATQTPGLIGTSPDTSYQQTRVFSVLDYDDSSTFTTMDTLMQYQNIKETSSVQKHVRFLKPKYANRIFATGVSDGFKPGSGFIDCTYNNVEHYGVKFGFQAPSMNLSYDMRTTFYLAFKNVR
jgi:hypothetical protein